MTSLAPFSRYRPPPFAVGAALPLDDDQSPDYQPLSGTSFDSGDSTGPGNELGDPPMVQPSMNRNALDQGAGKLPSATPHPMAGGPGNPPMDDPGPTADEMTAARVPPAMKGGPPISAERKALDEFLALKSPPPPKPNVWQKLGAAALGGAAGYYNAANPHSRPLDTSAASQAVLMGPKFIRDEKEYKDRKAELSDQIKQSEAVENIESLSGARKERADTYAANEKDRTQINSDRNADRNFKYSLDMAQMGGKAAKAEDPIAPGAVRLKNPTDPSGKTFVDIIPNKGTHKVDDKALADQLHVAVGMEVPQIEYLKGIELIQKNEEAAMKLKTPADRKTETKALQIGGKPHQVMVDAATGDFVKDLGESGEKPPVTNVNAGISALDRETKQYGAKHEKSFADANSQLDKINDAAMMVRGGAMDQALGVPKVMTAIISGAGSGVRITQAELSAIAHARGIIGDIEGTLRSWAGQGKLTPEQQRQLSAVLSDVKARVIQKRQIASDAMDSIYESQDRKSIIAADKAARDQLMRMESPDQNSRMETQQHGADTYQRKAGSNDPWVKVKK